MFITCTACWTRYYEALAVELLAEPQQSRDELMGIFETNTVLAKQIKDGRHICELGVA